MKTIIWRTCVRQTIVETVVWEHRVRFMKVSFQEHVFANPYLKLLFRNETPRWAYENYHLEHMRSPNHIRNLCFGMRLRVGLMKTAIWRTCVRQTILKTNVF